MSQSSVKTARRVMKKQKDRIVLTIIEEINEMPFKDRLKLAWRSIFKRVGK